MSLFDETLPGTYSLVRMPDGSEAMMHRLRDGRWVTTEERAKKEETDAFMARFAGTDTAPAPHTPETDGAVERIPGSAGALTGTRNRLEAYLVEILGDPALIVARDTLAMSRVAKVRARPQEMRHVLGLIDILHKAEWNQVKAVIVGDK